MLDFIDGKKAYLVAAAVFVVGGLQAIGVLDANTAQVILAFLGASGLAAIRHGIAKGQ